MPAKRKSKPSKVLVAIASDLHTNSTIGLLPPRVSLDDGGEFRASREQRWLWSCWLKFWGKARAEAEAQGARLVAIINGDALDGDHHNTPQIVTRNPNDQILIGAAALAPVAEATEDRYFLRGTGAHAGPAAAFEEMLARDLDFLPDAYEHHARWHLYARFGGVTFDIKHHPESGSKYAWTRGNGATRVAAAVQHAYWEQGKEPPDLALRSHRHTFEDSGRFTRRTYACLLPPWQLPTEFAMRIGAGLPDKIEVGGMLFLCSRGNYEPELVTYRAPKGRPETLVEREV